MPAPFKGFKANHTAVNVMIPEAVRRNPGLCAVCKGTKHLCGQSICPLIFEARRSFEVSVPRDKYLQGPSPPSFFTGEAGYPAVFAGPLVSPGGDHENILENPSNWLDLDFARLISMRLSLVRSMRRVNVRQNDDRMLGELAQVVMGSNPVDLELALDKPVTPRFSFSFHTPPMGPSGTLERVLYVGNPSVPRRVQSLVDDRAVTASHGIVELWEAGVNEVQITNLLTAGLLGRRRTLVPTRWGITAVDDTLSKTIIARIKKFSVIDSYRGGYYEALGNRFAVVLVPSSWRFEMLESWAPFAGNAAGDYLVPGDRESGKGRTNYASELGGAYYAARLGVVQGLLALRRQAECLVFMEVTKGWLAPLGVWRVREGVRRAMACLSVYESLEAVLGHTLGNMETPRKNWLASSEFIAERTRYVSLDRFLGVSHQNEHSSR